MSTTRVVLNHAAIGELLKSHEVEAVLMAKAEAVKSAAESLNVQVNRGVDRGPMPYEIVSDPSESRARVYVVAAHPAGLAAEAKYGALTSSIDAA